MNSVMKNNYVNLEFYWLVITRVHFKKRPSDPSVLHIRVLISPMRRARKLGVFGQKLEGSHSPYYHYFETNIREHETIIFK